MRVIDDQNWKLSPRDAVALQQRLRGEIVATGDPGDVRLVAGVDVSAGRFGSRGRAAVVVLEYPSLRAVEQSLEEAPVPFPYVPGLLSFREIPLLLPAFERLQRRPDLLLVDGQGVAHPRRFGLAAHLGLILGLPTIGCAKSRLIGSHDDVPDERGASVPLRADGETIGAVVRTRPGVKPLYISVGHRIGLRAAVDWVLRLTHGLRLPEPTRLAHEAAAGVDVVALPPRTQKLPGRR